MRIEVGLPDHEIRRRSGQERSYIPVTQYPIVVAVGDVKPVGNYARIDGYRDWLIKAAAADYGLRIGGKIKLTQHYIRDRVALHRVQRSCEAGVGDQQAYRCEFREP